MTGERFAVMASETYDAGKLGPCKCCGGIADYVHVSTEAGTGYRAVCSVCGLQTALFPWAAGAAEAWNRSITSGARVVTLEELIEFRGGHRDDNQLTACWIEYADGRLRAALLNPCVSMEGTEVYDTLKGDYWPQEAVKAEGIRWRLWDKRPTTDDTKNEPWGQVKWHGGFSEAAAKEAERVKKEIEERKIREAEERQRQARRKCAHCGNRLEQPDAAHGYVPVQVCTLDGHTIHTPYSETCTAWKDDGEEW